MKFRNRSDAGKRLVKELEVFRGRNVIVLAIPRGGIPVGYEIARAFGAPLDVIMAKKIGAPFNPELAIGAVTWNGAVMIDQPLVDRLQVSRDYIGGEARKVVDGMNRTMNELREGLGSFPKLYGRTVFVVDDGIATGATMIAAVEAIRDQGADEVVIVTPVIPSELVESLKPGGDARLPAGAGRFRGGGPVLRRVRDYGRTAGPGVPVAGQRERYPEVTGTAFP